jgi:hypothetical protein
MTAAEYAIKEAYVTMAISGLEIAQNRGKEQMFDLMEARIKNGEKTLNNLLAVGVYSDGTASTGKQIGGLAYLVASTRPPPAPSATSTAQRIPGGATRPSRRPPTTAGPRRRSTS